MKSNTLKRKSVFALLFALVVLVANVDLSARANSVSHASGTKEEIATFHVRSNNEMTRELQGIDLFGAIRAILESIPNIALSVAQQIATFAVAVIQDPLNVFTLVQELVVSVATTVTSNVFNVVAAFLPSLITSIIGGILEGLDPLDAEYTSDTAVLYSVDTCAVSYTTTSLVLTGLTTVGISGLKIGGLSISGNDLSGSPEGDLSFDALTIVSKGNFSSNGTCVGSGTFEASATMTEPTVAFSISVEANVAFNETTDSDDLTLAAVSFETLTLENLDYEWTTTATDASFDLTALETELSKSLDELIDDAKEAATDSTNLLDTLGIELPYVIDTGTDIPLLG